MAQPKAETIEKGADNWAGQLFSQAQDILRGNDKNGRYTVPAAGMYPHQWLWDSCFVAIGLRHYNVKRAQAEITSLFRGQWSNGMLPNMVFNDDGLHRRDRNFWRSWVSPFAPNNFSTSGITQPPMVAEAVVKIGQKMTKAERRTWYQKVYPKLVKYHQWLYADRDPHGEGLVLLVHPWETGQDNTPVWISQLHSHQLTWWIRAAQKLHLESLINFFRRDVQFVPPEQRLGAIDALALYSIQHRLRRKAYAIDAVLEHSLLAIEDVGFNAVFIRANQHLQTIAKQIGRTLPEGLRARMEQTEAAFEQLWDDHDKLYYSRNFGSHEAIKLPTLASLLPLYAGSISKERAQQLVKQLGNKSSFKTPFPVPSVPINSDWFSELGYWQGPTWINTNWLLIDGLRRYGFEEEADQLSKTCLDLVEQAGFSEYFSPLSGAPAGIANFSWTAALTIDLLKS
jgi:hypothetical protein